jgi:hypothetical protein
MVQSAVQLSPPSPQGPHHTDQRVRHFGVRRKVEEANISVTRIVHRASRKD